MRPCDRHEPPACDTASAIVADRSVGQSLSAPQACCYVAETSPAVTDRNAQSVGFGTLMHQITMHRFLLFNQL